MLNMLTCTCQVTQEETFGPVVALSSFDGAGSVLEMRWKAPPPHSPCRAPPAWPLWNRLLWPAAVGCIRHARGAQAALEPAERSARGLSGELASRHRCQAPRSRLSRSPTTRATGLPRPSTLSTCAARGASPRASPQDRSASTTTASPARATFAVPSLGTSGRAMARTRARTDGASSRCVHRSTP